MKRLVLGTLASILGVFIGVWIAESPLPKLKDFTTTFRESEQFEEKQEVATESSVVMKRLNLDKFSITTLFNAVSESSADQVIYDIAEFNDANDKPILLLLDSPGGSVIDGARIISAMQSSKNPVYTACMQLCASMAAMILSYGEERYAVDRSIIMFHPASVQTIISGELDKVVSRFSFLKRYIDKMDHYVAARSKQQYEVFKAKSSRELWIDAEDALKQNYIDNIVKIQMPTGQSLILENNKLKEKINLNDDIK